MSIKDGDNHNALHPPSAIDNPWDDHLQPPAESAAATLGQENTANPWDRAKTEQPTATPLQPPVHLTRTDFMGAIARNKRQTIVLVGLLLLLGTLIGGCLGLLLGGISLPTQYVDPHGFYPKNIPFSAQFKHLNWPIAGLGAAILLGISAIWTAISLSLAGYMVASMQGAQKIGVDEAAQLHNVVEEMALAAGLPKPAVYIVPTNSLNAFAFGMRPEKAGIAVTTGLLEILNRDELQGVIAHEMGHVANLDIRFSTALAVLVGVIVMAADALRRIAQISMITRNADERRSNNNPLALPLMIFALILGMVAPFLAFIIQMAASREREYLADATAVRLTRNPYGLIAALEKLEAAHAPFPHASRATQHMFIINPFRQFSASSVALFSTHPPTAARIERLKNLH
ncbi:MAG: M48 family metallopeptidase [Alphaproteobacteria bacterium]